MSFFQLPSFLRKKQTIEHALKELIGSFEEETQLKKAVEYSFFNGGKRIRPIIVLMMQEAMNCPYSLIDAAISVELFHTASLIADDLPSMDNDAIRRDQPSTHIQFGETVALLASYGLISLSFEKIHDCASSIAKFDEEKTAFSAKACLNALKVASSAAGIKGATLGQYYDLFPNQGCSIEKLIYLKTVTLFEVSFLFGWLFAGGEEEKIDEVKKLSYHLGMAYQIADDLNDQEEDLEKGKSSNYAIAYGVDNASAMFSYHLEELKKSLGDLQLMTGEFSSLVSFLEKYGTVEKSRLFL
jgi:geranylgeranyl diphosphate synthase type II